MQCKIENDELVFRLPVDNIRFYMEKFQDIKIISSEFYQKIAEHLLDMEDSSNDKLINRLLDTVCEKVLISYPELSEELNNTEN